MNSLQKINVSLYPKVNIFIQNTIIDNSFNKSSPRLSYVDVESFLKEAINKSEEIRLTTEG